VANLNKVLLIGNLTRDVETRQLPSGAAVTTLGLAINESYTNKAGERREITTFVDTEVWGHQAETCSRYLSKGRQVLVEGGLKLDQWQDQEGNNRSKLLVRASSVTFLDAPRDNNHTEGESSPTVEENSGKKISDHGHPPELNDLDEPPF